MGAPVLKQANETPTRKAERLLAVDALRGLIVIVMALDHANHFVAQKHSPGEYWGGPFPVYHESLPFLTRLITHLAAPGFFFLMGASMLLFAASRQRHGQSRGAIIRHFLLRGGTLIALQFLIVNRAWEMSSGGWVLNTYVGVLFALGGGMILGSFLLWLRPGYLLLLTLLLFLTTELAIPDADMWDQAFQPLSRLLLIPGGDLALWVSYPVLPWLELVTFGLFFGHWLAEDLLKAYERGLKVGVAFLLAFLLFRYLGNFGNIRPVAGGTWIDFLNVVKYPPSMTFTLLTMGVNLIVLWLFSRIGVSWPVSLQPLSVFGRAPLFFYVLHLFLYAGLGLLLAPGGTSIPKMFPYWILGLLILYPLCLWYGRFKQSRPADSILRLF